MAAGACDLESTLHILLAADIVEVHFIAASGSGELGARIHHCRLQCGFSTEEICNFPQTVHAIDLQIVYNGSFAGILSRHYYASEAFGPRLDGHGKHTAHRQHRAVERQLSHNHVPAKFGSLDEFGAHQYGNGDWQIIGSPLLLDIGGSHIDYHSHTPGPESALQHRRAHTFVTFLDRRIGKTHDAVLNTFADHRFNSYNNRVDAVHCSGVGLYKHVYRSVKS